MITYWTNFPLNALVTLVAMNPLVAIDQLQGMCHIFLLLPWDPLDRWVL